MSKAESNTRRYEFEFAAIQKGKKKKEKIKNCPKPL